MAEESESDDSEEDAEEDRVHVDEALALVTGALETLGPQPTYDEFTAACETLRGEVEVVAGDGMQ